MRTFRLYRTSGVKADEEASVDLVENFVFVDADLVTARCVWRPDER